MNNCTHCGQPLQTPDAKAHHIHDFFTTLSRQHQGDFMNFHSISFPISYTVACGFVKPDSLTANGIEWVENLYREVLDYEKKPESQSRFKKGLQS